MPFNCFTYLRLLALFCLSLFLGGNLPAQAPLLVDNYSSVDLGVEVQFEWRMGSAGRALQSGLSGVAETIYRSLLEKSNHLSSSELSMLRISLAKALIGQGRFTAARVQLDMVPEQFQDGQYLVYLALSIYGEGDGRIDSEACNATLKKVSLADLKGEDLPWLAMLQGLAAE